MIERRTMLGGGAALVMLAGSIDAAGATLPTTTFGLIGSINAKPGQRDALIALILANTAGMPGCLSYIVAKDADDADAIWITEVWESEASHAASLKLPGIQRTIKEGVALMDLKAAGFRHRTQPIGGTGLANG